VRRVDPTILHLGTFSSSTKFAADGKEAGKQDIDVAKRVLHSRIHTAGHIIGLAAAALKAEGVIDKDVVDGKASHYPGAAFVEFVGLIPGDKKAAIQAKTDELVDQDLEVKIHFWDEERARKECTGVLESFKQDDDGVRVVEIGDAGSYPCGGTHVKTTKGCGRVVIRNIKRQKGITKVSYEVQDA
jgi:Ser-tRNA(Ala) deacylase AlaX